MRTTVRTSSHTTVQHHDDFIRLCSRRPSCASVRGCEAGRHTRQLAQRCKALERVGVCCEACWGVFVEKFFLYVVLPAGSALDTA
jgi:hypothetical protein